MKKTITPEHNEYKHNYSSCLKKTEYGKIVCWKGGYWTHGAYNGKGSGEIYNKTLPHTYYFAF